jgi:hypothetical protein
MTKDMTAPNWARKVAQLRRHMDELRAHGVRVIEPPDFDVPPSRRGRGRPLASGGTVPRGTAVILGEQGPELLVDGDGRVISDPSAIPGPSHSFGLGTARRSGDHGLS